MFFIDNWLVFFGLVIFVFILYKKFSNKVNDLQQQTVELRAELSQAKLAIENIQQATTKAAEQTRQPVSLSTLSEPTTAVSQFAQASAVTTGLTSETADAGLLDSSYVGNVELDDTKTPAIDTSSGTLNDTLNGTLNDFAPVYQDNYQDNHQETSQNNLQPSYIEKAQVSRMAEPDEQSLPMVTSLGQTAKNWFFGGNLVVRVGVIVLLMGVVLLLRLLSEYIHISIEMMLSGIGIVGLALAGLGLKLVKKRFTYGITLQGAGLAIAYLSTFFAYRVYHVLPGLPSFVLLGVLSVVTVALAVRQNAFPLALLAFSGAFLAPLLTSDDTGSIVTLFSYYLLLNVAIAIIAHYRTWKVLNLLSATVTFGLAYCWGLADAISTSYADGLRTDEAQRWSLVAIVGLHWVLYLFIAIRYAQQILNYNSQLSTEYDTGGVTNNSDSTAGKKLLYPIDTGLMFATPLAAFGLFVSLLHDVEHELSMVSAVMAVTYLFLGWKLIQRNREYALLTEGMLALGFGFLVLILPIELDAQWVEFGWSVEGLALVWFGRRSLRAWSVLFGIGLQAFIIFILWINALDGAPIDLVQTVSAICALASLFILRGSNAPIVKDADVKDADVRDADVTDANVTGGVDSVEGYTHNRTLEEPVNSTAKASFSPISILASVNTNSVFFKLVWRVSALIYLLTFTAMSWGLYVIYSLLYDVLNRIFEFNPMRDGFTFTSSLLIMFIVFWLIDRYRRWQEVSQINHAFILFFYTMLLSLMPSSNGGEHWTLSNWLIFTLLCAGWLIIGQVWIKRWMTPSNLSESHPNVDTSYNLTPMAFIDQTAWLGTGIILLTSLTYYRLPDSDGVMPTIVSTVSLLLITLWVKKYRTGIADSLPWFNWRMAVLGCGVVFIPILLGWVIISNWFTDGIVWGLPYIPVLNLYDMAVLLVLIYGLGTHFIYNDQSTLSDRPLNNINGAIATGVQTLTTDNKLLLKAVGIIGFWVVTSMLIRTLHAYAGTPLWYERQGGAWANEQVQTSLTILWTLIALFATFLSSKNGKRFWWIMGISLMGVVVLKLVLVDLSQTDAIWRVISFLGAGSLILLIGYLAPLPPDKDDETKAGAEPEVNASDDVQQTLL